MNSEKKETTETVPVLSRGNENSQVYVSGQEEEEEDKGGVTFSDIWHMIVKHWKGLCVFTAAALAVGLIYGLAFKKPVWESKGAVIVLAKSGDSSSTSSDTTDLTVTNLNFSLSILPTVVDTMNGDTIINNIVSDVNTSGKFKKTDYEADDIKKLVKAQARTYTSLEKSLYIDIVADTSSTELSKFLVTSMLDRSMELTNQAEGYTNIFKNAIQVASNASAPVDSSMSVWKISLIAGLVGLLGGALYGIIFEMANTHVVSEKELEAITGVKNIGTIPDVSVTHKKMKTDKHRRHAEENN